MVDGDVVVFSIISALVLATAIATVVSRRLFQSALLLAATLVGVAVLFLSLRAEFLFVIQLLVYVGAIVTLILFAIMFTHGSAREEEP